MAEPTFRSSATASPPPGRALLACRVAAARDELAAHFRIRHQVFVVEQGLFGGAGTAGSGRDEPNGQDRDGHDGDPATVHVIGLADGVICGTVRLYPLAGAQGRWQGDRLAVLAAHRHQGLGAPLVRFAVAAAALHGGQEMEAYIQPPNVTFFEGLGWRRAGGLISYAGRPHQRMLIGLGR